MVTGANGFLGKHLVRTLTQEGKKVYSLGVRHSNAAQALVVDLSKEVPDLSGYKFDEVYHLAGLAHRTPRNQEEKELFDSVNHLGTKRLLQSLEKTELPQTGVLFLSSVAVYGLETGEGICEDHPRKAEDAYGKSKRLAEDALVRWAEEKKVNYSIVRAPLIAGPNPPGNLGALIRGLKSGKYLRIGGGLAKRSIVAVDEMVRFLPTVLREGGVFHLTDGEHPRLRDLEKQISSQIGRSEPLNLAMPIAFSLAKIFDFVQLLTNRPMPFDSQRFGKMTQSLTFDDSLARERLNWSSNSILKRMDWVLSES